MAIDKQRKEVVLVFEMENKQDSYGRCLSTINYFENAILNNAGGDVNSFYSFIKQIPESFFTFHVNQRIRESFTDKAGAPVDKMENPINPGEHARIPVPVGEEGDLLAYAVDSWRKEKDKLKRPLYHIRIKFDYEQESNSYRNLDNLQFLAMFMQQAYITFFDKDNDYEQDKFTPNKLKERLSIFLIPHHTSLSYQFADEDPNADTSLYSLASQYLRLIAKMHNGVIYGWSPNGKAEAVSFTKRIRNSIFFPLLYLSDISSNNNYQMIFENAGMPDEKTIEKSFEYDISENDPRPFNNAGKPNPHDAMADIILDETRARVLDSFASISDKLEQGQEITQDIILKYGREEISNYKKEIAEQAAKYDRFTFALFGYLLSIDKESKNNDDVVKKTIDETMKLARELGDGIRQIVQNSIQHSQYHICYISFLKVDGISPSDNIVEQFRVRVTDLNTQKTVTETFIETLKAEKKDDVFSINDVEVTLDHLLGEFGSDEKVLKAWYDYRKKDASAHIGLTMFHNTLWRCQCRELQIISNPIHKLQDDNEFKNIFGESNYNEKSLFPKPEYVIPGTQISFSIPIVPLKTGSPVNLVQLANNDAFSEDYAAFAHYLDYEIFKDEWEKQKPILEEIIKALNELRFTSAKSKIEAQDTWKLYWQNLMKSLSKFKQKIHFFNVKDTQLEKYLEERDNCEVFIKGFFAAASLYHIEEPLDEKENNPSCIYIESLPSFFVDILQEVSVPLSLMDFPQDLQVFFSCKDNTAKPNHQPIRLLTFGNCIGHAVQNAYILSLEHGEDGIDTSYYDRASKLLTPFKKIILKDILKPQKKQYVCPFTVFEQLSSSNELPQYFTHIAEMADRPLNGKDKKNRGYKLNDIHMRLGNKVHADSFYELSFLFYRTSVANRTAFYIIKKMIGELINAKNEIVFFGYASYSQAMIVSLQKILQIYFKKKNINKNVHYAIYQYNLQSESFLFQSQTIINSSAKDKTQIYSTLDKREGEIIPTSVVQIVPIGSTLTTFDKMRAKYEKDREGIEESEIIKNYNVFLVRDSNDKDENGLSLIEKDLWKKIEVNNRKITVDKSRLRALEKMPDISYIIERKSEWRRPKECELCFPENVNEEKPLVETDPTSTVPSLQIYHNKNKDLQSDNAEENDPTCSKRDKIIRLSELLNFVYYGHFLRGKNHYQYYIDTQKYISKDKIITQLKNWLIKEREKEIAGTLDDKKMKTTPVLNIIFSPEHNSSVGFSQLVNAYFFNGTAEIVSVNVDKQFRSNFNCEHDALKQTIDRLLAEYSDVKDKETYPVHFFFVDDNIISGGSFRRANDLLQSMIPKKYRNNYNNSVFSKCFILIDRLSSDTKCSYIADSKNNFLSFCKINISNMRTHGDSCVGCKLVDEAKDLFKRSATRSFANYWAKKILDNSPVMFDDLQEISKEKKTRAFVRMLLTHVVENKINRIDTTEIEKLFDIIVDESMKPRQEEEEEETALVKVVFNVLKENQKQNDEYIDDENIIVCLLEHIVKILSRPFLSYNVKVKECVLKHIINICEAVLTDKSKEKLAEKIGNVLKKAELKGMDRLDFVVNCLFEALSDMKSTYPLRKETIKKAYLFTKNYTAMENDSRCSYYDSDNCIEFIKQKMENASSGDIKAAKHPRGDNKIRCFWKKYAFHIHKIIDGSGDETRSLWMEYLFTHGEEFPMPVENEKKNDELPFSDFKAPKEDGLEKKNEKTGVYLPLFDSIIENDKKTDEKTKHLFKEFCMEIFLQNSCLLYDGIENNDVNKKLVGNEPGIEEPGVNSYFLQNMKELRSWDFEWAAVSSADKGTTEEEINMFNFINKLNGDDGKDTNKKYKDFINSIINMVEAKYDIEKKTLRIALVTEKGSNESVNMSELEFIKDNIPENYSPNKKAEAKFIIKQRIIWALREDLHTDKLKENYDKSRLIDDGYYLALPPDDENRAKTGEDEFDFENDANAYRKPFFILRFDNIPVRRSIHFGRDAQPIDNVYIYLSFEFQSDEEGKEKTVPILIMRDILSYRNRIMRMLESDFSSHLMQLHAHKTGENTILKHEKTVSHTSTSDYQLPKSLWRIEKQGKADEKPLNIDEYEWLLFRNYINTQIAKLFNRTLLSNDKNEEENEDKLSGHIPKLYLNVDDINEKKDDDFKLPAENFLTDLFNGEKDRRILLCNKIINFYIDDELKNGKLAAPKDRRIKGYFNREYLKCVLFDIFLSCAKYWDSDLNFLPRIKRLKECKEKYDEINNKHDDSHDPDIFDSIKISLMCNVFLFRDKNELIIINPVKTTGNNILNGWEKRNERIKIRLKNPIDSFDGHMSLFTISNYIKGNYVNDNDCKSLSFEYRKFNDLKDNWKSIIQPKWSLIFRGTLSSDDLRIDEVSLDETLWFVSSLPIFAGEE